MADHSVQVEVPFPTPKEAEIAYSSLRIDKEPKRGGVKKILSCNGKILKVEFHATEARKLRVSVNGFFQHLALVIRTIKDFGPPVIEPS